MSQENPVLCLKKASHLRSTSNGISFHDSPPIVPYKFLRCPRGRLELFLSPLFLVNMVNWSDAQAIRNQYASFLKLVFALFGVYVWELFMTSNFEWSLITGQRRFRWPLVIFFFLSRYCMLLSFIGLIISTSVQTEINCLALYTFNSWAGNMSILCASISLLIRTIALWERKLSITIPLFVLCLGHWGLLYRGMFIVHASWDSHSGACLVSSTDPALLKVIFFFTMTFDFIILVCTSVALMKHSRRTDLWKLLFQDGLVYFLVSFTTNAVPAILNVLNLNSVMNVIGTIPAACISVIAACRAVIRLQEFNRCDVYVHTSSNVMSPNARLSTAPNGSSKLPRYTLTRPEVHVTTEHITMAEYSPSSGVATPYEKEERVSDDLGSVKFEMPSPHERYGHGV